MSIPARPLEDVRLLSPCDLWWQVRGGSLKVRFSENPRSSDNPRAEAFASPAAAPLPPPVIDEEDVKRRVQDVEDMLQASEGEGGEEGEGEMSEEEAMRSIMEALPSLDLQVGPFMDIEQDLMLPCLPLGCVNGR